jgi:formylglycine-generating enzyme required for sulfatase activity
MEMEAIIKKCLPTYDVIRKVGEGVYGTVYHIKDRLKERAVKVVPLMVERSFSYRSERELDSKISHDFHAVQEYYGKIKGDGVIEIHDFHLVDKQISRQEARAYLIILMEYCPGSLSSLVLDNYPLDPATARRLMRELAQTLHRLSGRAEDAFIVKDLKPSNLLINGENRLIIGDLGGLQRVSSLSTSAHAQFTPNWSAPELIIRNEAAGIASLIYSFGFVSYFIWFGSLPYEKANFSERLRLIRERGVPFDREDIPYRLQGLIERCLQFHPKDRPETFVEIIDLLNSGKQPHPAAEAAAAFAVQPAASEISIASIAPAASPTTPPAGARTRDHAPSPAPETVLENAAHSTGTSTGATGRSAEAAGYQPPPVRRNSKIPGDMYKIGDTWVEPVTGMIFAWVPSGGFLMGAGQWDGEGNKDEFPVHEVDIDGFWIAAYPVTQSQWEAIMSNPFLKKVRPNNPSWFKMGKTHPVEQASWHDAQEFIAKLIAANKGNYHFRLPTEAEWEYAARSGGRPRKYAGGKSVEACAWYMANSGMTTRPVGEKLPNELGLYDMSGNIYEWCQDTYSETGYQRHDRDNPVLINEAVKRVIRGGSWSSSPHEIRCAYRASVNPDFKGNYIGFRLVMTPVSRKKTIG